MSPPPSQQAPDHANSSKHPASGALSGSPTANEGFRSQAPTVVIEPPRPEHLQKSYTTVVDNDANPKGWYGSMINTFGAVIGTLGAIPCCIVCPNPYKNVNQGNVGLITKFGKFYKAVDPGLVKVNPLSERLIQVDVKIQIAEVGQQICMTKDNVAVQLTSVIYYHIVAPSRADVEKSKNTEIHAMDSTADSAQASC